VSLSAILDSAIKIVREALQAGKAGGMDIRMDFDERPFIVIWETTQACDLSCVHCRACAQPFRSNQELSTDETKRLIDEIAAMEVPLL